MGLKYTTKIVVFIYLDTDCQNPLFFHILIQNTTKSLISYFSLAGSILIFLPLI